MNNTNTAAADISTDDTDPRNGTLYDAGTHTPLRTATKSEWYKSQQGGGRSWVHSDLGVQVYVGRFAS